MGGVRSGDISVGTTGSAGSSSYTGSSAANFGATGSSGQSAYTQTTATRFGGEADTGAAAANIVIGSEQLGSQQGGGVSIQINGQEQGHDAAGASASSSGTEYNHSGAAQGVSDGTVSVNFIDVSGGHQAGAGHH